MSPSSFSAGSTKPCTVSCAPRAERRSEPRRRRVRDPEPEPEPESGRGLEDSARGFEAEAEAGTEAGTEVEEGAAKVGAFVGRGGGEDDEEEGAGGRDADFEG